MNEPHKYTVFTLPQFIIKIAIFKFLQFKILPYL
jgi:hypothetical protein